MYTIIVKKLKYDCNVCLINNLETIERNHTKENVPAENK